MVQEKLIIHNFGGIAHMELEFKRINLFIGPQASGKSLVVKLAYFFKRFFHHAYGAILDGLTPQRFIQDFVEKFVNCFLFRSGKQDDFRIRFETGQEYWEVLGSSETKISIGFSDGVRSALQAAMDTYSRLREEMAENRGSFGAASVPIHALFAEEFLKLIPKELISQSVFIPAGRGFFATIRSNVFSYFREKRRFDPFFIDFGVELESALQYVPPTYVEGDQTKDRFNALVHSVLKGEYVFEGDEPHIIHIDGRKTHLSMASSGQQEVLPLLLLLKQFRTYSSLIGNYESLIIEEPEGHIFPTAQKQVVHLMAHIFNRGDNQLFITTHSPYVLTAFNNLLQAGQVLTARPDHADRVYQIVPQEEILHMRDFAPYYLKDGEAHWMVEEETGLIAANMIDDVSDQIGSEFEALLDLAYE